MIVKSTYHYKSTETKLVSKTFTLIGEGLSFSCFQVSFHSPFIMKIHEVYICFRDALRHFDNHVTDKTSSNNSKPANKRSFVQILLDIVKKNLSSKQVNLILGCPLQMFFKRQAWKHGAYCSVCSVLKDYFTVWQWNKYIRPTMYHLVVYNEISRSTVVCYVSCKYLKVVCPLINRGQPLALKI